MKRYAAEFLATFTLMFLGTGAAVVNEVTGGTITHPGVALTFGLVVMVLIYTFGEKSGAHMKPAVTVAFTVQGTFPRRDLAPYLLSQAAGALAGSGVLHFLFPQSLSLGGTLPAGTPLQSLVLEFFLTFFLMLTIVNVAQGSKEKGLFAGLAIGSLVLVEAMFAGPVSGASMNPVRSLAPALVSGQTQHLWVYMAGPFTGALSAIFVYRLMK